MNKKNTVIAAVATTIVGVSVGAGTAGVRYFKNDENRSKFLGNDAVQKVRKTSSQFLEQVRNRQAKLQSLVKNYKNELEEADAKADAEMQGKEISSENDNKEAVKASKNQKNKPESVEAESTPSIKKQA